MTVIQKLTDFLKKDIWPWFLLIAVLLPNIWLSGGYLFVGEEGNFADYGRIIDKYRYSWSSLDRGEPATNPYYALQIPNGIFWKFFSFLGVPNLIIERLFISLQIFVILLAASYFVKEFTRKKKIIILGSLFYLMNFYARAMFFYTPKTLQVILTPFFFVWFCKFLESGKWRYLFYNYIAFFSCQSIFSNLSQTISTFLVFPAAFLFFLVNSSKGFLKTIKEKWLKIILYFLVMIPLFFFHGLTYKFSLGEDFEKILWISGFFTALTSPLSLLFQLRGVWWEFEKFEGVPYDNWNKFYDHPLLVAISLIILVIIIWGGMLLAKNDKEKKKSYSVLLLFYLITLALASGFSFIPGFLQTFFKKPSFLLAFREPWAKFLPLSLFFEMGLFSLALEKINQRVKSGFFLFLIFVLVFVRGYPFFSPSLFVDRSNVGWKKILLRIPSYWYDYRKWSAKNSDKYVVPFPFTDTAPLRNWHKSELGNSYFNIYFLLGRNNYIFPFTNPVSYHNYLARQFSLAKNANFVKLGPVDYLLDQKDINAEDYQRLAVEQKQLLDFFDQKNPIAFGEKLYLYPLKKEYLLPHVYVPKENIYLDGDSKTLIDIVSFPEYHLLSGIYIGREGEKESDDNEVALRPRRKEEIFSQMDQIIIKARFENMITEEELAAAVSSEETIFPYQTRDINEYDRLRGKSKETKERVRNDLYLAREIISRISRIPGEDDKALLIILDDFEKKMDLVFAGLAEIKDNQKEFLLFYTQAEAARKIFRKEAEYSRLNEELKRKCRDLYQKLGSKLTNLKENPDFSHLKYNFYVPEEGDYEVLLKGKDGLWKDYGLRHFQKGQQSFVLPNEEFSGNLVKQNLKIENYEPSTIYRISFDYKSPEKWSNMYVVEDGKKKIIEKRLPPTGSQSESFEVFFRSSASASTAKIFVFADECENVKIQKIYQPEVMLRRILKQKTNAISRETPDIDFVKINPTKYHVNVKGAKGSYFLIFAENFNRNWKLYYQRKKAKRWYFFSTSRELIAEESHDIANGYANSWYIAPKETKGEENYELIIEYEPQRLFSLSFLLTMFIFIFSALFAAVDLITRKNSPEKV